MVAQSEAYPFLGLEEHDVILWMLRACKVGWEPDSGKRTWVDSEYGERSASSTIWMVKTLDDSTEELCAVWIDDTGDQMSLQACVNSASPSRVFIQILPQWDDETVKLVLERF
ncbi:hypothetical protein FRB95_008202 [Tulasnella sp. JGI-2019a]|nr:hypothetical protein FRB95_008202 [Tulasnella sp. JGI-2019a]